MPDWLLVVFAGVLLVLLLLALGGAVATSRRRRAEDALFFNQLGEVNRQLAMAHAADKGWERAGLESAARRAWTEHKGEEPLRDLSLIEVVDRPGTEDDQAVFRAITDAGLATLTLGRRGEEWYLAAMD